MGTGCFEQDSPPICRNPSGRRGNKPALVCPWRWTSRRTALHIERREVLTVSVASATLTRADGSQRSTRIRPGVGWRYADIVVVAVVWAGWEAP